MATVPVPIPRRIGHPLHGRCGQELVVYNYSPSPDRRFSPLCYGTFSETDSCESAGRPCTPDVEPSGGAYDASGSDGSSSVVSVWPAYNEEVLFMLNVVNDKLESVLRRLDVLEARLTGQ